MEKTHATLHLLCGKIASGKSTLAAQLSARDATVLIAEDDWVNALFSEDIMSISDYMNRTAKLRSVVGPHVVSLLNAGLSVVLDFQANTRVSRDWMRGILNQTDADHQLHILDVPDALCITRLRARNTAGDHPFAATEEQFRRVSEHHVLPTPEEGFNLVWHTPDT